MRPKPPHIKPPFRGDVMAPMLGVLREKTSISWDYWCERLDKITAFALKYECPELLHDIVSDSLRRVKERESNGNDRQQQFEEQLPERIERQTGGRGVTVK